MLTTKHHDGVALWPTKQAGPSIVNERRKDNPDFPDIVAEYLAAIRAKDIKAGLYFSHCDWTNDAFMEVLLNVDKDELKKLRAVETNFREMRNAAHDAAEDQPGNDARWQEFLDFHRGQLTEILSNYGNIDLLWFDVMMRRNNYDYKCAELRDFIHGICDATIINSRLEGHGDYGTPEQFLPVYAPKGEWEFCVTTNNTWSYTGREEKYKSPQEIVTMFCECLGMGGNMLLNIGPDEHGRVPEQQRYLLLELGKWIRKHEEAVYETVRGLPHGYAYHMTSLSPARDVLYVYCAHDPKGNTPIKGIKNEVKRVSIVGTDHECAHKRVGGAGWLGVPGTVYVDVPREHLDEYATVLKLELDGTLDLYGGEGREIDEN